MKNITSAFGFALLLASPWAAAQSQDSPSLYLEAGSGRHGAYTATLGVTLPWNWAHTLGSGQLTGAWDLGLGTLSARPEGAQRRSVTALGAGINLRWRPAQGASRWFVEAGTGLVWHNRHYANGDKYFGTRYNFASHLGVGRNFGPQGRHALALRVQHQSNAGIKKPNPGDDFLLLRYAVAF